MCGIAGTIGATAECAAARASLLNDAQTHRGPDHKVIVRVGEITLGNTRLAIQDPTSAGNQPFVSVDGRYACVFNGEIYNHRELVERFRLPVRTSCDGEVIAHLWAKLGVQALTELRGMFAIAIADSLEERLYLARDPFGIKPLYWRLLPDGVLAFASEVRPLVRLGGSVRVDDEAVARYLLLGAMAADQSPFLEIAAVPPNSVAVAGRDGSRVRVAVRPIRAAGPAAVQQAADLGAALTESIDLHLASDVPTALLLSGGVDSAAIAVVGRRLGRDLHCLTVTAEGAPSEAQEASRTALRYGHRFQEVRGVLDDGDVARFFQAMQRPTIDGLNTYLVCKAVHDAGFKVALSGLGGDEAVGGYSHFRLLRYLPMLRVVDSLPLPAGAMAARLAAIRGHAGRAKASRLLGKDGPRTALDLALLQRELFPAPLVSDLTGIGSHRLAAHSEAPGWPAGSLPGSFSALAAAEVAVYLQAMLLPDADVFSMASSVELRVPFVDGHVFAAALAGAPGRNVAPGKTVIGAALGDPYLVSLARQLKRGFSLPMGPWLVGPLAPLLAAASEPDAPVWSLVDRVMAMRAGIVPLRPRRRWAETWALVALNAWLEAWAGRTA
jgi:asparagine synthase (glutamine-hydrolysing)